MSEPALSPARAPRHESFGWVIETHFCGQALWWKNGHGWMRNLHQATVFPKQHDAIKRCVSVGGRDRKPCAVRQITFSTGRVVYPPSRKDQ